MLLCMLLMYTTAHSRIRQQCFEAFWYTHHLFIPFFLALYTHTVGCFVRSTPEAYSPFAGDDYWKFCIGYLGWRWELWTGGLYLLERLYREIRAIRETKITRVIRHPYSKSHVFTGRSWIVSTVCQVDTGGDVGATEALMFVAARLVIEPCSSEIFTGAVTLQTG